MKIKFADILPKRPSNADKNRFGRVLIAAGSANMMGAAFLAGLAAFRAGAGLVYCAVSKKEKSVMLRLLPEAIIVPLEEKSGYISVKAVPSLLEKIKKLKIDVLNIGPGLGEGARDFAFKTMEKCDIPMVIDADALNALAENKNKLSMLKNKTAVLTPHMNEMKRLIGGFFDRKSAASKLNSLTGCSILLKGKNTIVTDGKRFYQNKTGGPVLAKGGTGDVLSGILASVFAQKNKESFNFKDNAFFSACLSAHIHGLCGEIAAEKIGERSVLAKELTFFIGEAFGRIK